MCIHVVLCSVYPIIDPVAISSIELHNVSSYILPHWFLSSENANDVDFKCNFYFNFIKKMIRRAMKLTEKTCCDFDLVYFFFPMNVADVLQRSVPA